MTGFEYNSERERLIIPEYGRHIQRLVQHVKTIDDRDHRNFYAKEIIRLMVQMVPQNKNVGDFQAKLWKHLFKIANYQLDVDVPEGVDVSPEKEEIQLPKVEYPQTRQKYPQYGHHVSRMIEKAIAMEDGPKKQAFIRIIASYMKMAYKNWNKDHNFTEEMIKNDLDLISSGQLTIGEDMQLDYFNNVKRPKRRSSQGKGKGKRRRR